MYETMIWSGAAISVLGLAGLIWCIVKVARAKKSGLNDDELRAVVATVVPLNMAALFLSVIGLMLVVIGVILG